jgi:pilus assembly protein Flp/PilA
MKISMCPVTGYLHLAANSSSEGQHTRVMEPKMNLLVRFLKDQSGATAIEYGLIAAGISVAIIAVVNSLGSQLNTTFSTVSSQLATAGK